MGYEMGLYNQINTLVILIIYLLNPASNEILHWPRDFSSGRSSWSACRGSCPSNSWLGLPALEIYFFYLLISSSVLWIWSRIPNSVSDTKGGSLKVNAYRVTPNAHMSAAFPENSGDLGSQHSGARKKNVPITWLFINELHDSYLLYWTSCRYRHEIFQHIRNHQSSQGRFHPTWCFEA